MGLDWNTFGKLTIGEIYDIHATWLTNQKYEHVVRSHLATFIGLSSGNLKTVKSYKDVYDPFKEPTKKTYDQSTREGKIKIQKHINKLFGN